MTPDYFKKGSYDFFLGIVAEDKKDESRELKVYCPEILSYETDLTPKEGSFSITLTDKKTGNPINDSVTVTNVLTTRYLDLMTNRTGPPDIVKEEQVMVFHYADTDEYYWFPLGRDDNLRLPEHIRIAASDDRARVKVLDKDNTYYIEIDTKHDKTITIRTSDSDGEKYRYLIQTDSKNNTVTIQDNDDNEIWIESDTPRILLKNRDKTFVDLDKTNLYMMAPQDIVLKADRQMLINTPNLTCNIDEITRINTTGFGVQAKDTAVMEASTIGLNGAAKVTGPVITGPAQAPTRSIGPVGPPYPLPETDLASGGGESSNATPDDGNGGAGNRTMLAWEQLHAAIVKIVETFQGINGQDKVSLPGSVSEIIPLSLRSKMPRSKGDPEE